MSFVHQYLGGDESNVILVCVFFNCGGGGVVGEGGVGGGGCEANIVSSTFCKLYSKEPNILARHTGSEFKDSLIAPCGNPLFSN